MKQYQFNNLYFESFIIIMAKVMQQQYAFEKMMAVARNTIVEANKVLIPQLESKKAAKRQRDYLDELDEQIENKYFKSFSVEDVNETVIVCEEDITCDRFTDVISFMCRRVSLFQAHDKADEAIVVSYAYKATLDNVFEVLEAEGPSCGHSERRAIGFKINDGCKCRKCLIKNWPASDATFWDTPHKVLLPKGTTIEFVWIEKENGPKFTDDQKRFVFDGFLFFDKLFSMSSFE